MIDKPEYFPWKAYKVQDAYEVVDARGVTVADYVQRESHANLIAAAPAILESLKHCLDLVRLKYGNLYPDTNEVQRLAKLAIDQAEGREP